MSERTAQPNVVWLASYPKSGNTWVRAFLTRYRMGSRARFDLNKMYTGGHFAAHFHFDDAVGIPSTYFTEGEIEDLQAGVIRWLAGHDNPLRYDLAWPDISPDRVRELQDVRFIKVHDRFRHTADGGDLFPTDCTRVVVLIVRNPLSIVASLANHLGTSIPVAIRFMNNPEAGLSDSLIGSQSQFRQPMGTWSENARSWLEQTDLPVHLVRYEELRADPVAGFSAILAACGARPDPDRVAATVDEVRFDRLSNLEQRDGFRESASAERTFFRKGQTHSWREELTPAQVTDVITAHCEMMQRLGYDVSS